LQAEALGFEGDGAAAGKGVMQAGELFRVEEGGGVGVVGVGGAGLAPGFADFGARFFQHWLVGGVFPDDQFFEDLKEAITRCRPTGFEVAGGQFAGMLEFPFPGGVVDELGEDDGAGGGEGAARPPEVEGAGVAVADRFFAGGGFVDGVEGEGDFDEFFGGDDGMGHGVAFWLMRGAEPPPGLPQVGGGTCLAPSSNWGGK
jgi:hypothetical protein